MHRGRRRHHRRPGERGRLIPRLLAIGGSDSGAGAGIQADLKTAAAHGVYATVAITALTAQDTERVHAMRPVPAAFVAAQIAAALDDIGADVVKTGMLANAAIVERVAALTAGLPRVIDPVCRATGGAALLDAAGLDALRRRLLPGAALLTPNIPEAELLLGRPVLDPADAARALLDLGPAAVLLKGGHGDGDRVTDWLATETDLIAFAAPRLASRHTHGTGCTLATAIAAGLAWGLALPEAVGRARAYVQRAIETAPGLGRGHGPLNHAAVLYATSNPHIPDPLP